MLVSTKLPECQLPNQIYNLCHKKKLVEAVLSIFSHQYFQCACPAYSFMHVIFQAFFFSSQQLIFFEPDILPEHPLCSELSTAFFGGTSSYPPIQSANRPITDKSHIIMPPPYAPFRNCFWLKYFELSFIKALPNMGRRGLGGCANFFPRLEDRLCMYVHCTCVFVLFALDFNVFHHEPSSWCCCYCLVHNLAIFVAKKLLPTVGT